MDTESAIWRRHHLHSKVYDEAIKHADEEGFNRRWTLMNADEERRWGNKGLIPARHHSAGSNAQRTVLDSYTRESLHSQKFNKWNRALNVVVASRRSDPLY